MAGKSIKQEPATDRLQPILRGDTYCAPRCGLGCKRAAYDRAVEEANALANRLGQGWEPVVWDNLGWHYGATKGVARVRPRFGRWPDFRTGKWSVTGYTVYLNSAKQFVAHGDTPEDALGFAIQDARTTEHRIAADCSALSYGEDG